MESEILGVIATGVRQAVAIGVVGGAGSAAGHYLTSGVRTLLNRPAPVSLSEHGGYAASNPGPDFVVPQGTKIRFYSEHGESILDSLGNKVETSAPWPFHAKPVQVAKAGDVIPDYTFDAPVGLTIKGNPITVTTPTQLSDLVGTGGRTFDWAACRNLF